MYREVEAQVLNQLEPISIKFIEQCPAYIAESDIQTIACGKLTEESNRKKKKERS